MPNEQLTTQQVDLLHEMVGSSVRMVELARVSDAELADRLRDIVWTDLPVMSLPADLVDEAINRLQGRAL